MNFSRAIRPHAAHPHYDVLIVGGGPVGCAAAILLAREGLRVALFDRSSAVYDLPRAVFLDGESVRAFQRVGLGDEIDALLQPWRENDAAYFTDSARNVHFGIEMPPYGSNGWRDGAFFDQPELEGRLRELMAAESGVDVHFAHEVTAIEQDESKVTLTATDLAGGRTVTASASWLIACDGASSFVRRTLGIPWRSLGYDHEWLVIDIVMKEGAALPKATMQVCDPARLTTYICGKDPYRRWEFRLLPGETREQMARPETIRELLAPWIQPEHYDLRRAAVYQFHAATAGRWREGRVLLAGDAAHQTPPFLGQGLNAGIRDVVNLAWKLPLVRSGSAPASLLDTYAAERDAHAHELVDWAVAVGRLMEALADAEAGRSCAPPPDDLMRSGYGQGRTAPPLRRGIVVEDQVSDAGVTGYLFSQPTVADNRGNECMLDELLGKGFAIAMRGDAEVNLSDESCAWLLGMGARIVDISTLELRRGHWDRLFGTHAAALIRPDRYVFGVTDERTTLEDLVCSLKNKLFGREDAPAEGVPA